jgi:hypothetical protein
MQVKDILSTSKASIYYSDKGHIVIELKDNQDIEAEDIREINIAKNKLANGRKYTVVFKVGKYCSISSAARKLAASKEVYRNALAKAIVVDGLPARMIGNFFININKPPAPTKIVNNESEAFLWLESVRDKSNSGI